MSYTFLQRATDVNQMSIPFYIKYYKKTKFQLQLEVLEYSHDVTLKRKGKVNG